MTNVHVIGNTTTLGAPILAGALYTLPAASLMVGKTENAISILLCRRPHDFDDPHYRPGRGKMEQRLITARDLETLKRIWRVYVKPKRVVS